MNLHPEKCYKKGWILKCLNAIANTWLTHRYLLIPGRELPDTEQAAPPEAPPPSPRQGKAKKLVTQGQADNLNIHDLKKHTTLTFEIDTAANADKTESSKYIDEFYALV